MRFLFHGSLALVLAACGSSPSNTAGTAQSTEASAQQQAQRGTAAQERPFNATEVMEFSTPWAMDFLPGSGVPITNMALVTEKEGNLWLVNVASGERQQVAGVPQVKVAGQGGLGDVVAHPDFAGNRRIYLSYVEAGSGGTSGAVVGYGRLVLGDGQPRLDEFRVIWRQRPKVTGDGHFSHRMAFAPDGSLFLSSGDRQKLQPAQNVSNDLGKILRLTDEGKVPRDNPYVTEGDTAFNPAMWSLGHRNILGLAFGPDGRLWASEMGPEGGDELNLILAKKNYGWPEVSYGSHYGGKDIPDSHSSRGFEEPKAWWNPAISPGGMLIYTGDMFPQWKGDALIGGLSGQNLVHVDLEEDRARKANEWDMDVRIRAVDQGPNGEVYLLEDGRSPGRGRLLRLTPAR